MLPLEIGRGEAAMPSEKLTRILLSKSPFSQEQISAMTDAEGWKRAYANNAPDTEKHFEVCFTAFSHSEKGSLSHLSIDSGFMFVTPLIPNFSILSTAPNPPPL